MRVHIWLAAAFFVTAIGSTRTARADVVLVSATADAKAAEVIANLDGAHQFATTPLGSALVGDFGRETINDPSSVIEDAKGKRTKAFDAYGGFRYPAALRHLADAESALVAALPHKAVLTELGENALLRGQVELAAGDKVEATAAFRLASSLSGREKLDAGMFPPAVVRAFAAAVAESPTTTKITITGNAWLSVEVDGKSLAAGDELELDLEPGRHYAVFSSPGYAAEAQVIRADESEIAVTLDPLEPEPRLRALRAEMASKPSTRTARLIADTLDVKQLMFVVSADAGLSVRLYDRASDSLTEPRPATADSVKALLGPPDLNPKKVVGDGGGTGETGTVDNRSWISRNKVPVLVTTGAVAATIAAVALYVVLTQEDRGDVALDSFCGYGVACD